MYMHVWDLEPNIDQNRKVDLKSMIGWMGGVVAHLIFVSAKVPWGLTKTCKQAM